MTFRYNRLELAGSLGDLGTLLPIAAGMVAVNGLNPVGLFFSIGVMYLVAGYYYRVPIAVQPMKVIGAYALAVGATAAQVSAAGWLMGLMLVGLGWTGLVDRVAGFIPRCVIRGVQLSTGILLTAKGASFVAGTSSYQVSNGGPEPWLWFQYVGPVPMSVILGVLLGGLTLHFLDNKRFPAGLVVIGAGSLAGILFGAGRGLVGVDFGLHLPAFMPFGLPSGSDFMFALFAFVLPQIPMTLGNAVIANRDLSHEYFGNESRKVTDKALCISMGLGCSFAALLGGMPLCHGAGGLAAHYRFGARTGGSNVIIGGLFVLLAVSAGSGAVAVLNILPMACLGVLLMFAGIQLGMTIMDLRERSDLFVCIAMVGVALAFNLAWAFGVGVFLAKVMLRSRKA